VETKVSAARTGAVRSCMAAAVGCAVVLAGTAGAVVAGRAAVTAVRLVLLPFLLLLLLLRPHLGFLASQELLDGGQFFFGRRDRVVVVVRRHGHGRRCRRGSRHVARAVLLLLSQLHELTLEFRLVGAADPVF